MMKNNNRRAQEEMIGFAFIIVVVSVILLIFVVLTLNKPSEEIQSYEVESFLSSLMQTTTNCQISNQFVDIQTLIFRCDDSRTCLDGRDACEALNSTLDGLIGEIWKIKDRPEEGYVLKIIADDKMLVNMFAGNQTGNYKGAVNRLPEDVSVSFRVYY